MTLSPTGWAYEIVSGGDAARTSEGLVPHEVRFWDTAARQRDGLGKHHITAADGERPTDLMNSFLMQIRTNHQRMVALPGDLQFPEGYTRHVSGLAIPNKVIADAEALATFLTGKGLPLGGYEPFMFPIYAGELEPLNGMWQHELHTVSLLQQAEGSIERYITVAKREGWEGDKRGTTLNLQVSAGGDDAGERADNGFMFVSGTTINMGSDRHAGIRFTGVSGLSDATIDSAILTFRASATNSGDFIGDWFADDQVAAPSFSTGTGDISNRTRTTTTCEGDGVDDFGSWSNASDETFIGDGTITIADIIQELADSFDPSTIALLYIYTSGGGTRQFLGYENSTTLAAKLDITFTAAAVGNPWYYYAQQEIA